MVRAATAKPQPRALIVGIDGGSFDLIDELVARRRLPNLAKLLKRSASARTTTTWPAHTAPGWSSYVSASNPGGHGIYQFFDTQEPGYGARITESGDLGRSCAWDWLAAQGWTLGLVNMPMSYPPRDLHGYQITWPLRQTIRYCQPATLLSEMAHQGAHFQSDLATMFRGDMGYLGEALDNVQARLESVRYLMRTSPTDLVILVLTEADRVCHHYWQFCDPGHPRYTAPPPDSGWDLAIEKVYDAIDAAVGELVDAVDEDTVVSVVSDHGLGLGRHGLAVHRLLEEAGLLATRPRRESAGHGRAAASCFVGEGREVDFEATRVYMPVPGSFGLNVNLRGRQRDGIVPAAERRRLLDEVTALLEDVRRPEGGRVLAEVVPREVVYPGPHCGSAPDLVLIPRDESVIVTPEIEGPVWRPSWQTGLHRYAGMWLQASSRVRPGRLREPVRLADLVPTLLADLGMSWPSSVHGRPVHDALRPEVVAPPPLREDEDEAVVPGRKSTSGVEDTYTSERLREMGY